MQFHVGSNDNAHAEFHPHDGSTDIYLGDILTLWDLIATIVHEELHRVIDEAVHPDETTESQDHWAIQRICF